MRNQMFWILVSVWLLAAGLGTHFLAQIIGLAPAVGLGLATGFAMGRMITSGRVRL